MYCFERGVIKYEYNRSCCWRLGYISVFGCLWVLFSLVCMSMIVLYVIEFDILNNGVKVLAGEYNFIITWIIVLVEIWVGFGMQIYGKKDFFLK